MIQPIRAKKIEPPKTIWVPPLFATLSTRQEQNNVRYISVDQLKGWADKQAKLYHGDLGTLAILVKLLTFIESNE